MAKRATKSGGRKVAAGAARDVDDVVAELRTLGRKTVRDGMARYGIPSGNAFGVAVGTIQKVAKGIGRDHALATALWESGQYEARLLAAFVGEPEKVTGPQMDRWCREFDSWAVCDTVCFHLFDRVDIDLALGRATKWCGSPKEFVKRGGLALIACVALHRKDVEDARLRGCLELLEAAACDERNFVKKAVSWAARGMARRKGLQGEVRELAERWAKSGDATERWVGRDVLRGLKG